MGIAFNRNNLWLLSVINFFFCQGSKKNVPFTSKYPRKGKLKWTVFTDKNVEEIKPLIDAKQIHDPSSPVHQKTIILLVHSLLSKRSPSTSDRWSICSLESYLPKHKHAICRPSLIDALLRCHRRRRKNSLSCSQGNWHWDRHEIVAIDPLAESISNGPLRPICIPPRSTVHWLSAPTNSHVLLARLCSSWGLFLAHVLTKTTSSPPYKLKWFSQSSTQRPIKTVYC